MEFLSLSRRRSSPRNVLSDEERGETDVFAGYCSVGEHVMSVHTNLGKVVQLSDTESHVAHDTT